MGQKRYIEDSIQRSVASFMKLALPSGCIFWHTPNQAGTRSKAETARLKAMGVLPGIPDILVWDGNQSKLLAIELKSPKGVLSASQKQLFPRLESLGITVAVCRSIDEVAAALESQGIKLLIKTRI